MPISDLWKPKKQETPPELPKEPPKWSEYIGQKMMLTGPALDDLARRMSWGEGATKVGAEGGVPAFGTVARGHKNGETFDLFLADEKGQIFAYYKVGDLEPYDPEKLKTNLRHAIDWAGLPEGSTFDAHGEARRTKEALMAHYLEDPDSTEPNHAPVGPIGRHEQTHETYIALGTGPNGVWEPLSNLENGPYDKAYQDLEVECWVAAQEQLRNPGEDFPFQMDQKVMLNEQRLKVAAGTMNAQGESARELGDEGGAVVTWTVLGGRPDPSGRGGFDVYAQNNKGEKMFMPARNLEPYDAEKLQARVDSIVAEEVVIPQPVQEQASAINSELPQQAAPQPSTGSSHNYGTPGYGGNPLPSSPRVHSRIEEHMAKHPPAQAPHIPTPKTGGQPTVPGV